MLQVRRVLTAPFAFRRNEILQRAEDARVTAIELHRRYIESHAVYERRRDAESLAARKDT